MGFDALINLNSDYLENFITGKEISVYGERVKQAHQKLHKIEENSFKGWLDLPVNYDYVELEKIKSCASKIRKNSDILIVIGIGGSYLGARAAIEFLNSENYNITAAANHNPQIFFVGNSIDSNEISEILSFCDDKDIFLNVISKSGTTTEPGIAFRIFKQFMESKYGKEEAGKRIFCTTDPNSGALRNMAREEGYECFSIPCNIGGRYSVLTAVGMLPVAVSGANIDSILEGARDAYNDFQNLDIDSNACYRYAAIRNILYNKGWIAELMAGYSPRLRMFFEWWKQLFGESEGKDGKGIFPVSAIFTTDLHSLGQFIQDGSKILFETNVKISSKNSLVVPKCEKNLDGLSYLAGKSFEFVNQKAFEATVLAHYHGGVPGIMIETENFSEYSLGYLIYFFEKACAISGYLLGINPFNQPGVEAYKTNMFKLLGKPGY